MNKICFAGLLGVFLTLCLVTPQAAQSQLTDNPQNICLFHLDAADYYTTTSRAWMDDDDSAYDDREHNLVLGDNANTPGAEPVVTAAGTGFDGVGEALQFFPTNEVNAADPGDCAYVTNGNGWNDYDSVKLDFWFKRAPVGTDMTLFTCDNGAVVGQPWEVRLRRSSGDRVYFYVFTDQGTFNVNMLFTAGVWNHVVLVADTTTGELSGEITPQGGSTTTVSNPGFAGASFNSVTNAKIWVGCKAPGIRHYGGFLDEVAISVPTGPQVLTDDFRTLTLLHFDADDEYETTSRIWMNDDDSVDVGRNADAVNGMGKSDDPNYATPVAGRLYGALEFDGGDFMQLPSDWADYDSVKIDLWFKSPALVADENRELVTVDSSSGAKPFFLRLTRNNGNKVFFAAYHDGGVVSARLEYTPGVWNHVVAEANPDTGLLTLDVTPDGGATSLASEVFPGPLRVSGAPYHMEVGALSQIANFFDGQLDELKISIPTLDVASEATAGADDEDTLALWHMDAIIVKGDARNYILDDDSVVVDRDADLLLGSEGGSAADPNEPEVTTGGVGIDGEALWFQAGTGLDEIATAPNLWLGYDSVKIDFWMYVDSLPSGSDVMTPIWCDTFIIRLKSDGTLQGFVKNAATGSYVSTISRRYVRVGRWHHVTLEAVDDVLTLTIDGAASTTTTYNGFFVKNSDITLGNKSGTARWLDGLLDEVRISVPNGLCGAWGYSSADINKDCVVDLLDATELFNTWLNCSIPGGAGCVPAL